MHHPCLLLTRPKPSALRFVETLDRAVLDKVDVCFSPLIQIVPLPLQTEISAYDGVILSSANAVGFLEDGQGRPAFCVGQTTAQAAKDRGWDVRQTGENADELVSLICEKGAEGPLLHLCGIHRRGAIAERLTAFGIPTDSVAVYDQQLLPLSTDAKTSLAGEGRVILPLFSPRTAAQFADQVETMQHVVALAISSAVADAVRDLPFEALHIAKAPTAQAMRQGVEMLVGRNS